MKERGIMNIYVCYCGFTMIAKEHMKRHLNKKRQCIPGISMSGIDVNTLLQRVKSDTIINNTGTTRTNLSSFSEEEIRKRELEQRKKHDETRKKKNGIVGIKTERQFAAVMLKNMKEATLKKNKKGKNHIMPDWTVDFVLEFLYKNNVYIVKDTILGDLEFHMMITNSYYNSASFDRIDDNLGYSLENIEIRPQFLNSLYKLTTENIRELVEIREQPQDYKVLLSNYKKLRSFMRDIVARTKNCVSYKTRIITIDFKSDQEFIEYLIYLFIQQGGKCAYSYVPIYPIVKHKYKLSIERKNPLLSYNKDNIVLITIGLNGRPCGQFLNKNISEEQRTLALNNGIFNQKYWDTCTKLTDDIRQKCELSKDKDRKILESFQK